jgi:hypothetical protein
MRRTITLLIPLMTLMLSASALARVTTLAIKGTCTENPGACSSNSADYDSICPSNNCVCDVCTGTIGGPLVGRGSATVNLTIDNGSSTPASGSGCKPFFGKATFSTNRESESDDTTGTICSGFGNPEKDTVSGGFGIESSGRGEAGWGKISGMLNESVTPSKLTLNLSARITP